MSHDDLGVGATDQEARQRLERVTALLDAKQKWLRRWTVPLLVSVVALIVASFVSEPLIMSLIAVPLTAAPIAVVATTPQPHPLQHGGATRSVSVRVASEPWHPNG